MTPASRQATHTSCPSCAWRWRPPCARANWSACAGSTWTSAVAFAHLPDTKNGEARSVPLSSTAIQTLRALPRSLHGQVFPGLTTEAVKRAFARAVRRAGIEDLRFHDLRHEATSRLFERGLNIMEVASITGHKDLRMLRRYTHLKAEDLARKLG